MLQLADIQASFGTGNIRDFSLGKKSFMILLKDEVRSSTYIETPLNSQNKISQLDQ